MSFASSREAFAQATAMRVAANANPGRDYELALGLAIANHFGLSSESLRSATESHRNSAAINRLANDLRASIAGLNLLPAGARAFEILDATQDDSVGPADLILRYDVKGQQVDLGISIKCQTDVSYNPSGRRFLAYQDIRRLDVELRSAVIPEYRSAMTKCHGIRRQTADGRDSWHRKRSRVTTDFICRIGKRVAERWNNEMTDEEKSALANRLSHNKSPIPYLVARMSASPAAVEIVEADEAKRLLLDATKVTLKEKKGTQFVYFYHPDRTNPIARMQVKFNYGILRFENGNETVGDPFSSWNFEFLQN